MKHCFVVLLEVDHTWLALSRDSRREYASELYEIIGSHAGEVNVRYFDADAFSGKCTDFVICETENTIAYHHMWEALKDSRAFCGGFYRIKDVVYGIQNAYQAYETEKLGMEAEAYTT
ncbi:Darcynin 2 [Paenibacillus sp. SYP-B3998]|uniref:Darcynin 2 n=1 Tax=Paenibacillus sp. SYP-B3998 TaxID=2678564 RepID=A0A6G3ZZK0_9BACL|nr:darcynin family protein [Paenibacillus sp. SYP-B3998]NEW07001.1 Darcynin 2 [Paenibacillus sp. SYP-B3998]